MIPDQQAQGHVTPNSALEGQALSPGRHEAASKSLAILITLQAS